MKSVKPGRGPSMVGGFAGLFVAVAGGIWCWGAYSIGAPLPMVLFGGVFILFALCGAIYNFVNAFRKRRHSAFDITDDREEPDPLNERFGEHPDSRYDMSDRFTQEDSSYCPYCGTGVQSGFEYCPKCGRRLP